MKQDLVAWTLMGVGIAVAVGTALRFPEMTDRELFVRHPVALVCSLAAIAVGAFIWAIKPEPKK